MRKRKVMNMTVELTKKYLRIRVKHPRQFTKIRTDDIGRKGHSMRLAGVNRKTGKWETQAWLVSKKDIKNRDIRALMLLNSIAKDLPKDKRGQILRKVRQLT